MIGVIGLGVAIALALFALWGALLCLWAQRKDPATPLPIGGVIGILVVCTAVISVVVGVGV